MSDFVISCIVPVYNGERYLREALDSILSQTYRLLEIIVVDDGSTDGTQAVVKGYGDQVKYIWQPNSGPAVARNRGMRAGTGDFVAFLDADDLWHREKLGRQMGRFVARPEVGVSVCYVQNFWSPESRLQGRSDARRVAEPQPGYLTQALLARKAVFELVGPFDGDLAHASELDWFMRAAEQDVVTELLADVLVYRRLHGGNFSQQFVSRSLDEHLGLLKASLDRRRRDDASASHSAEAQCADADAA